MNDREVAEKIVADERQRSWTSALAGQPPDLKNEYLVNAITQALAAKGEVQEKAVAVVSAARKFMLAYPNDDNPEGKTIPFYIVDDLRDKLTEYEAAAKGDSDV